MPAAGLGGGVTDGLDVIGRIPPKHPRGAPSWDVRCRRCGQEYRVVSFPKQLAKTRACGTCQNPRQRMANGRFLRKAGP